MVLYVPGTEETDPKKQNMSLQQIAGATSTATANVATNTANIATNTANIATNTAAITALNAATYVNSFKTRTGAVVPVQGDYPTSLIPGTITNDSATAGNIGEYVESNIAAGSAVSLVSGVGKTVTSISLTAGDWDVSGMIAFNGGGTTTVGNALGSLSLTTNAVDQTVGRSSNNFYNNQTVFASTAVHHALGPRRFSFASTTTVFLTASLGFGVSTGTAYGLISARRAR